jgi:hypothetical protein
MTYVNPTGGSRQPTPKPGPSVGRISMTAWRQPTGGVRSAGIPAPGSR